MCVILKASNMKEVFIMNEDYLKVEFEKQVEWILDLESLPMEAKKKLIIEQAEAYTNNQYLRLLNRINVYGKSLVG